MSVGMQTRQVQNAQFQKTRQERKDSEMPREVVYFDTRAIDGSAVFNPVYIWVAPLDFSPRDRANQ